MRKTVIGAAGLLGMMFAVYHVFGGLVLIAVLVSLSGVGLLFLGLAIGSGWTARLMERGAGIALQAQVSDDKRDIALIRNIVGAGKALARPGVGSQYPALPASGDSFNVTDYADLDGLEIEGLDQ